jgi:hypothetical protein
LTMKTETEIASLFALLNEQREAGIQGLIAAQGMERFDAMLKWDGELAPTTTDRQKFALVGVNIPSCFVPISEDAAEVEVERILTGYALWNEHVVLRPEWSFLQQYDALSQVMDDKIPLVAPKPDQHHLILDLRGVKPRV